MASTEAARQILAGLKEAGINLVASVPDINLLQVINLLYEDKEITHVPVGREEEGIGVCTGAHLAGKQTAILMQNGGLMNSCNGLTTTALQFGIPILLLNAAGPRNQIYGNARSRQGEARHCRRSDRGPKLETARSVAADTGDIV